MAKVNQIDSAVILCRTMKQSVSYYGKTNSHLFLGLFAIP